MAILTLQVYVLFIKDQSGYGVVEGADFPMDVTVDTAGCRMPEGLGVAVTDRTVDVAVIGVQIPPGRNRMGEIGDSLVRMAEITVTFAMARAARAGVVDAGGRLVRVVVAART